MDGAAASAQAEASICTYATRDGTAARSSPPSTADDVLEAFSDDILTEGDVRRALQPLMQRGLRGTRGGDVYGRRLVDPAGAPPEPIPLPVVLERGDG